MKLNPCYHCTNRTVTCHGGCKDYVEWKTYRDDYRDAEHKLRNLENIVAFRTFNNKILTGGQI